MSHLKDIKVGYQALGSLLKESGEFRKDFAMGIIDIPVAVTKAVVNAVDSKLGSTTRRYNIANAVNERLLNEYGDELSDLNTDVRHMMRVLMANKVTKTYNQTEEDTTDYTEFSAA